MKCFLLLSYSSPINNIKYGQSITFRVISELVPEKFFWLSQALQTRFWYLSGFSPRTVCGAALFVCSKFLMIYACGVHLLLLTVQILINDIHQIIFYFVSYVFSSSKFQEIVRKRICKYVEHAGMNDYCGSSPYRIKDHENLTG